MKMDLDLEAAVRDDSPEQIEPVRVRATSHAIVPESTAKASVVHPIPTDPRDTARMIEIARIKFFPYERLIDDMLNEVQAVTVNSDSSHKICVELGARAKRLGKEIDKGRDDLLKPANDFVKGVRAIAKPYMEKCDRIEELSKVKNKDWLVYRELERRKVQELARVETQKVQERVNIEAAAAGVETVQMPVPVIKEEKLVTRTAEGTAHSRATKTFKIINPALIPREYLMVDERAIREAIKRGVEQIPGVEIIDDIDIVYRT